VIAGNMAIQHWWSHCPELQCTVVTGSSISVSWHHFCCRKRLHSQHLHTIAGNPKGFVFWH